MIVFRGRTHIVIAITIYLLLDNVISLGVPIGSAFLCLALGSLLPDIDHPRSMIGKYIAPISAVVKHRGFTHTFLGVFIFPLPALYFGSEYYFLVVWGYLFHLLVDTLNPMGVSWLYPITNKKFSLNIVKTGSPEEGIIFIMCLMFILEIGIF